MVACLQPKSAHGMNPNISWCTALHQLGEDWVLVTPRFRLGLGFGPGLGWVRSGVWVRTGVWVGLGLEQGFGVGLGFGPGLG